MAFGFQNCCDTEEYFYLNGIPATVSENEVYSISTLEGFDFCATYVELPELYYQPLTYNLDVMVEQTSCDDCTTSNPCPDTIDIVLDENVTISNYNECSVLTEFPLEVECQTIQPVAGADYGQIRLLITGGQPPYSVFSANTQILSYGAPQEGISTIVSQAPPGEYCYYIVDEYNAVVSLCCTVNYSPEPLVVSCSSTPSSVWEDTGEINLNINGESPFTIYYQGEEIELPLTNLSAGTYSFDVIDSMSQTDSITCTVTEIIPNYTYPQYLCMDFVYCGAHFYLTFVSAGTQNYLPYYTLNNPTEIGVSSMTLSADTSFNWFTSVANSNAPFNVPPTCVLLPTSNGNVSFTKNTLGNPSPLGQWTSSGIFGSVAATVNNGQCIDNPPTFTAAGTSVCLLDGGSNTGSATITPSGGAGGPYTIYVDGAISTSPLVGGLSSGNHTVQVADNQSNLSSIGSVTIGTTNPTNLLFTSCGTLTTNLNSLAEYLNADFTAASSPINFPVGVQITGQLQLTVTYYLSTPNFDDDSDQYISDALAIPGKGAINPLNPTSPFVAASTYVNNNGVNTPITFNPTPLDTQWTLTATYPNVTEFINRQIYERTQVWTSTNTVTISNNSYLVANINTLINYELDTTPDNSSSNSTFFVQEISQEAQVNFKLSWINLDVSTSGCYTVDANPTIFEYLAQRTIPAFSYTGPFTGQFLNGTNCPTQPNCNEQFNMVATNNPLYFTAYVYDDSNFTPPIKTWSSQYNLGAKGCGNGTPYVPKLTVTRANGQNWVPGTVYYLRFKFSILPTRNVGVTFGPPINYCNATSGNGTAGYSFIIPQSQLTQDQWYYPAGVQVNLLSAQQNLIINVFSIAQPSSLETNQPSFEMQISSCPWT
jgi:hypothetical protein